ncbi:MAG: FkbM family methyltransferase [Desulfobacterales bacterium]|nr:FkbM family methyltransferase [Desulfobacterales bacterium]
MRFIERLHLLHSIWHYRYNTEKDDIKFVLGLALEGKTVIDVGANKGIYSYLLCKKVGKKGRVIAFEPQPELNSHLNDVKETFGFDHLAVVNKGLSTEVGFCPLFRPEVGSGGASVIEHEAAKDWEQIKIELTTLDTFCDSTDEISFIKCDVEGHEFGVFKGGQNLLKRDKPCLLFECHHDEAKKQELFNYLISLGYDGFFPDGKRMIHFSQFENHPYRNKNQHHRNYIFVHPDFIRQNNLESLFMMD